MQFIVFGPLIYTYKKQAQDKHVCSIIIKNRYSISSRITQTYRPTTPYYYNYEAKTVHTCMCGGSGAHSLL